MNIESSTHLTQNLHLSEFMNTLYTLVLFTLQIKFKKTDTVFNFRQIAFEIAGHKRVHVYSKRDSFLKVWKMSKSLHISILVSLFKHLI